MVRKMFMLLILFGVLAFNPTFGAKETGESKIIIENKDENNSGVEGAKFELYDSDQKLVDTQITDSEGQVEFSNLEVGEYRITEISMPFPYQTFNTTYDVSLTVEDQVKTLKNDVSLSPTGTITIQQVDMYGAGLGGCEYTIYDSDGNVVDVVTTDENGNATSDELLYGAYYVVQTGAPDGYQINSEGFTVIINGKEQSMSYKRKAQKVSSNLSLVVQDQNGNPLSDIKFNLISDDEVVVSVASDSSGVVNFGNIIYGSYTLSQEQTSGFTTSEDYNVEISAKGIVTGFPSVVTLTSDYTSNNLMSTGSINVGYELVALLVLGLSLKYFGDRYAS